MTRFAIRQTIHGHRCTIGTAGTPEAAEVFRAAIDRPGKPAEVVAVEIVETLGERWAAA